MPGHTDADEDGAAARWCTDLDRPARGSIGSPLFASVAADEPCTTTRPIDDIESLLYTLAYLAAGRLPWEDQPFEALAATKRQILSDGGTAAALTSDVECAATAAALEALYAEIRRCQGHGERREQELQQDDSAARVDYEACLAALRP